MATKQENQEQRFLEMMTDFYQSAKLNTFGVPRVATHFTRDIYNPVKNEYYQQPFWTLEGLMAMLPILKRNLTGEDVDLVPFLSKERDGFWDAGYMIDGTTEIFKEATGTGSIDAVINLIETMREEDMFFMEELKEQFYNNYITA